MLPFNKAMWVLGYSRLAMLTEQDRKHWLLKTDRLKQVEDSNNGGMYLGQIDNRGSYINISTQKLPYVHPILKNMLPSQFSTIFELNGSALPYSYDVNGLCYARITSSEYPYEGVNKNFKLRFENCEEVYIPFANEGSVFGFQFIKTTTAPKLVMIDGNGEYTIQVSIPITATNVEYYYPLDTFQPIEVEDKGSGVYETILINSIEYIGYPAFWFRCDETNNGPKFSADDSVQKFNYGNPMDEPYNAKVYVMDKMYQNNEEIYVYPSDGYTFSNTDADFAIPLDLNRVLFREPQPGGSATMTTINITSDSGNKLYMSKRSDIPWEFDNGAYGRCYRVLLSTFNQNYGIHQAALRPIFDLQLNNSIPFEQSTSDYGYAGIDVTATSQSDSYPFNLNQWDGLPDWITEDHDASQRLIVYAIHNTPSSSESNPESRQTAALIFDPGVAPDGITEIDDGSDIGRVYMLSNDDAIYVNNATATRQKPGRTLARICDIPISVAQLSNLVGVAPTPIVDPKYVRSEASYTSDEKDRLYNTLANKWVRPIHRDTTGLPIIDYESEDNEYVFNSLSNLKKVDLFNYNDFREHTQLNGMVQPSEVSLYRIADGGSGYQIGSIGIIVIGGFAFNYVVTAVGTDGEVISAAIAASGSWDINISNFDMTEGTSGITVAYGTSPAGGTLGTGLKVQLLIANYTDKIPSRGNVYTDLFALCRSNTGLWMYNYDTETNTWERGACFAEYETSSDHFVSTKESYLNSILPNVRLLPVAFKKTNAEESTISAISTSSFVNIIDTNNTPIYDAKSPARPVVDINRFHCDSIKTLNALSKNEKAVISSIKANHYDRYDSYIIWRWIDETSSSNRQFEFGVIYRSFNNLRSYDWQKSFLPTNELYTNNYVNTNASTTMVWDVQSYDFTMVWTFNPTTHIRESYYINANTSDLNVERIKMKWNDIDVYTDNFQSKIDLVDSSGNMAWNIVSNVVAQVSDTTEQSPIYQQADYVNIVQKGTPFQSIEDKYQPMGNWQLIFPRIQIFTFSDNSGTEYTPIKMNVIRSDSIQESTFVYDSEGNTVNSKTIVMADDEDTSSIKIYNDETGNWISI